VRIRRAPDDRPGYVIGVGLDQAAWTVQRMLPQPRVVEECIMDLVDEGARAAGEVAWLVLTTGGRSPRCTSTMRARPWTRRWWSRSGCARPGATDPRNLLLEWIDQQQAIAGGEAMSVDEMVAVARAEPAGVSTIVMTRLLARPCVA
jgi:hypothetical protein